MLSHRAAGVRCTISIEWRGGSIDVTVPSGGAASGSGLRVHEAAASTPQDRTIVDDRIPVTSLARTLLDLAAIL